MEHLRFKADSIIKNHVLFATGAGVIPIPLLDIAGVTAVQLDMLKKLTNLYGKNYSENVGKAFIASITTTSLARMGASALKAIPVIGQVIGGISMSIMAGASTYALGNVVVELMERGVGIENFDIDMAKDIYEENLEKGKKIAEDLQKQYKEKTAATDTDATEATTPPPPPPPTKAAPENDVYAELMKLGELKEKGIITEEEFAKMKKDIIDKF
ncbi:MAG: DUF697 domain-containing protein [Bacteroidota bacterium]